MLKEESFNIVEILDSLKLGEEEEDFVVESHYLLQQAEISILKMAALDPKEEPEEYLDGYNLIYRSLHSIKGGAGMLGFSDIESLAHYLEELFLSRKNERRVTEAFRDYFLKAFGYIREVLFLMGPQDFNRYDPDLEEKENGTIGVPVGSIIRESEEYKKFVSGDLEALDMGKVWKSLSEDRTKIIVVDDEENIFDAIEVILEDKVPNLKLYRFSDPQIALKEINLIDPDVIITDYNMPIMKGTDFAKILSSKSPNLPIIFISGFLDKEVVLDALISGAMGIIEKPFDNEKFLELVKVNVKKHRNFRSFKHSLNCLMYQISNIEDLLHERGQADIIEGIQTDLDNLQKFKKSFQVK